MEIFWLDEEGKRQSYGKIKPGDKLLQHTLRRARLAGGRSAGQNPGRFTRPRISPPRRSSMRTKGSRIRRRGVDSGGSRSQSATSPDGQWLAFFKDHNVYLRDTESHEEFALSDDGTTEDEYSGEFFWSPDSKKLVVLRTKKGDERKVYYVESSPKDQVQPKLHSYDYLKPGDKIPISKPQLFDVAGRKHIPDKRRVVSQSLERDRRALGSRFQPLHVPVQPARPPDNAGPGRRRRRRAKCKP